MARTALKEETMDEFMWMESPFPSTKKDSPRVNQLMMSFEVSSLQCPSCHEFFENAVILRPCHHSFCSKCIRRHLCANVRNGVKHQRACPVCNSKIEIKKNGLTKKLSDDEAILPNYSLQVSLIWSSQEVISNYIFIKRIIEDR